MQGYLSSLLKLWCVSTGLGLVGLPLLAWPCRALKDRGYAASKVLSALLTAYGVWLMASLSLARFGLASIIVCVGVLGLGSGLVLLRSGKQTLKLLLSRRREIAFTEATFLAGLALALLLIGYCPDITPGSEGLMDLGILSSVARTEYFPAKDVWLAGEDINYYYFGHVIVSTLSKLCGATPAAFYNPAKGLLFALFWLCVFSLGFSITGRKLYGLVAVFLVGIAGNLDALLQLMAFYDPLSLDWFGATRIIRGTINEFPFFSLLWGDLHAYVISLPLFALSLNLLFSLHREISSVSGRIRLDRTFWGVISLYAISAGALIVTNTWDFISSSAILLIIVVSALATSKATLWTRLLTFAKAVLPALLGSVALFMPFISSVSQNRAVRFVAERSDFSDFFVVFGIMLLPIVYEAFAVTFPSPNNRRSACPRWVLPVFAAICAFVALGKPTWLLLLLLVPLSIVEYWRFGSLIRSGEFDEGDAMIPGTRFYRILVIAGALIAFGCELFYVDDVYGGQLERMNTVFKLFLHVWVLWGIAAASAIWLVRRFVFERLSRPGRWSFVAIIGFCLAAGAVYPLFAPISRTGLFAQPYTLASDRAFREEFPQDAAAARWLSVNVKGQSVLAEATVSAYDWPGRISSFTGHCAVVGWQGHEAGWRNDLEMPYIRAADVERLYTSTDKSDAEAVIEKYGIELVYYGELERIEYGEAGLSKLEATYKTLYESDGVKVFDVSKRLDGVGK